MIDCTLCKNSRFCVIICGNHCLAKQYKVNISLLLCKKDVYDSLREFCLPVHVNGVYANGSFARDAEKQKNKLADDGGGLTTTIVFHPLFFPHCFTAVHRPLSLTLGFTVPCVVVVRSCRHHTLTFTLSFTLSFTFTFPINITIYIHITIYIRFQLETVRLLFAYCLVSVWFLFGYLFGYRLVLDWFLFGFGLVLA